MLTNQDARIERSELVQRHLNCTEDRCRVCMEDHWRLMEFYRQETGSNREDHLGRFRSMLDKRGIPAETEHGWGTAAWFRDDLIEDYLEQWRA